MQTAVLEVTNNLEKNSELISENLYNNQKNFLESSLGKVINMALDIGLKAWLPDLIEDEIIDIKDCILENGFKEGV